jgi:hypothetical protein
MKLPMPFFIALGLSIGVLIALIDIYLGFA